MYHVQIGWLWLPTSPPASGLFDRQLVADSLQLLYRDLLETPEAFGIPISDGYRQLCSDIVSRCGHHAEAGACNCNLEFQVQYIEISIEIYSTCPCVTWTKSTKQYIHIGRNGDYLIWVNDWVHIYALFTGFLGNHIIVGGILTKEHTPYVYIYI